MALFIINKRGFTLVELSIVIVIFGLLVAGIAAGKNLIETAKVRSIITDVDQFKQSVQAFYGQYNYLPGDFPTYLSQGYFGVTGGNGNGILDGKAAEGHKAYIHMSHAGLVIHKDLPYFSTDRFYPGRNAPITKYDPSNACIFLHRSTQFFGELFGVNAIHVEGMHPGASNCQEGPLLYSEHARAIDDKIDDGNGQTGKFTVRPFGGGGIWQYCVHPSNGTYYMNPPHAKGCILAFGLGLPS